MTNTTNENAEGGAVEDSGAEISGVKASKKLDPGFKRNIKLVGGAVAVALILVGFVLWKAGQTKEAGSRNATAQIQVNGGSREQSEGMSPVMAEMLLEKQRQEAKEAASNGKSYIPSDPMPTVPVALPAGPGSSALAQESYAPAPVSATENATYARQREGLDRQIRGLLEPGAGDAASVRQRVAIEKQGDTAANANDGQRTASSGQAPDAEVASSKKGATLINGHYIAPALLENKLDAPEGRKTYASASIASGPYKGAFLTGGANVVNDGLALHFDKMSFRGKFYAVDVTGLDESTSADAIAGKVDRRILERWIMPVTLATVGGYFQGKSQPGQTVVNVGTAPLPGTGTGTGTTPGTTTTGMTGVLTPSLTNEQAKAAGVAAGLQIAQREVGRYANAPIIVSKEAKFPMGLIFNAPVYEVDGK